MEIGLGYSRCSSYDSRNQRHSYHNFGKLSSKGQEALSQAGDIVEQTVAQIRVMLAFVGESRALQGYSSSLKVAQKLAFKDQVDSALEPLWHELKLLHKQAENTRTWNAERISDYTFKGNDTGSQTKYTVVNKLIYQR